MQVKDFLSGRFTVGEEQVNTVAFDAGGTDCPADAHGGAHKMATGGFVHVRQVNEVFPGDSDYLSRIQGGGIHEGKGNVVLIHEAGGCLTAGDIAENAVAHTLKDEFSIYEAQVEQSPELQLEQALPPAAPGTVLGTPPRLVLKAAKVDILRLAGLWHLGHSASLSAALSGRSSSKSALHSGQVYSYIGMLLLLFIV
jgi:hypothetical protein